jgi:hypothetical protein
MVRNRVSLLLLMLYILQFKQFFDARLPNTQPIVSVVWNWYSRTRLELIQLNDFAVVST